MSHEPSALPEPCLASAGYLAKPLPALDDAEGARVPESLPPVVDGHVHLFENALFDAIFRWFDRYGWPIRYKLYAPDVIDFLLARGVRQIVALHYAHKAGIAEHMNRWLAELIRDRPAVTAMATVFPGEPDARSILERAFASGLRGVKLHCHVQCFSPDSPELDEVYEACVAHDLPLVIHAGREPKSPGYRCDPYALCSADRIARVLAAYPKLRVCVPHLGADEYDAYERLLLRHDNLWLDTTMVLADYFPGPDPTRLLAVRPERILYGTDFPGVPFAWDRELTRIGARKMREVDLARLLGGTARELYGLPPLDGSVQRNTAT